MCWLSAVPDVYKRQALDYVVVKFPKWPFDKFVYATRKLGTQMKATGEVMAIGRNFEQALMKAVRGAEISHDCLADVHMRALDDEALTAKILAQDDEMCIRDRPYPGWSGRECQAPQICVEPLRCPGQGYAPFWRSK